MTYRGKLRHIFSSFKSYVYNRVSGSVNIFPRLYMYHLDDRYGGVSFEIEYGDYVCVTITRGSKRENNT